MRARNIKPGFFKNEDLAECSMAARLLFAGLWCMADREGRLEDRPKRIKAEILPYDNEDADNLLSELETTGFIIRYQSQGYKVIYIPKFIQHQRPHSNEKESELPPLDEGEHTKVDSTADHGSKSCEPSTQALRSESLNPDSHESRDSHEEEGGEVAAAPSPENDSAELAFQDSSSLLEHFQNPTVQSLVEKSLDLIASTRQTGKVAESVKHRFVSQLLQFEEWKIGTAITKYIEGEYWLDNKGERYLIGILRNVSARDYREVVGKLQQQRGQGEREPPAQNIQPTTWAQAESAERRTMAQWLLEEKDKGGEDAEQEGFEAGADQALDSIPRCEARSG